MRNTITVLVVALIVLLASVDAALAYQVSITAAVSKAEVKRGEQFTYTLSIIEEGEAGGQTRLVLPELKGFAVSSQSSKSSVQVARDKARKVTEIDYGLSSDEPGTHVIPPAKLLLTEPGSGATQEMTSNEVSVKVLDEKQGVIGGIAGDIRDIKEPKTLIDRIKLYFYGILALAVIALLILAGFAMYLAGKRKPASPAPAQAVQGPGARQAALAELERAGSLMADTMAFYTAAADAVRRYLAASHGISAMEATTQELVGRAGSAGIPPDKVGAIAGFFSAADMVKFAKFVPSDEEKRKFLQDAVTLVNGL